MRDRERRARATGNRVGIGAGVLQGLGMREF